MGFMLTPETPPDSELTFPVALPNGATAMCGVDPLGRIDPRQAYAPWLTPASRRVAERTSGREETSP